MAKYKYILTVIITLCTLITYAQPAQYTPMTAAGYQMKRLKVDSTLHLPSFCGVPTLRNSIAKDGALAIDTCGAILYMWSNQGGWDTVNTSGGGSSTDTTSLSNRINQRIDSIRRSGDSIFVRKNGVFVFQYKDSGGTIPTLQQVTNAGATTTNTISVPALRISNGGDSISLSKFGDGSFVITRSNNYDELLNVNDGVNGYLKFGGGSGQFVKILTNNGANVSLQAPQTNGIIPISVNGNTADISGNITISTGGNDTTKVPYTGANKDVNLGANDLYTNKVYLLDEPNGNYGSLHYTDGDFHIEDADNHKLLVIEDGFLQLHLNDTIQSNLFTTNLTQTRNHFLPNKSGTIALTSDTVSLSNRINTKLNATDTASLSNRINLKLNISDTTSLSNRINLKLNSADTASLSNRINLKLNIADTTSLSNRINLKLNSADTASLSNRINLKLNISDTTNMLSKYLRKTDTASLSNRINEKLTNLDLLQSLSYGAKAEPYGVTFSTVTSQLALTTSRLCLYPFNWNVSDSIRGIAFLSRGTTTLTQNNYNGVAIYLLSGGTLTRLTFTANNGTFWDGTANTWKTNAITPYFLPKGLYYLGYQVSGSAGTPTIASGLIMQTGFIELPFALNPNGVKISSFVTNLTTTPPSLIAMGTTTTLQQVPYFILY